LRYLPGDLAYHVIFIERALDEVLTSQERMKTRRRELVLESPARRDRLKTEYARSVRQIKELLRKDPRFRALFLHHAEVIRDPRAAAEAIDQFLGGELNVEAMAAQVNPSLHRNRAENRAHRDDPVAVQV
jgi:uncharacterized protein with von Willebrand factor type A (vWA) domain